MGNIRMAIRDAIASTDGNPPELVNSEQTVEFMYGKQADAVMRALKRHAEHEREWAGEINDGESIFTDRYELVWREDDF